MEAEVEQNGRSVILKGIIEVKSNKRGILLTFINKRMGCKAMIDLEAAQFEFTPLALSDMMHFKLGVKLTITT